LPEINLENKPIQIQYYALGFYSGLSKDLCSKLFDKFNELKICDIEKEKLMIYLNLLAVIDVNIAEHSIKTALCMDKKELLFDCILQKTEDFSKNDIDEVNEHPLNAIKLVGKIYPISTKDDGKHYEHNLIENKPRQMQHYALGFYSGLSKDLCNKIFDKFNELKISDIEREKLLAYFNLIPVFDIKTAEHSMRVTLLCEKIAKEAKMDRKALLFDGLLHDIGKVLIPQYILQKTEGFDENDMEIMRDHSLNTLKIIGRVFEFTGLTAVRHHIHQENGYPKVLPIIDKKYSERTQTTIDYNSRILAIADFFDAAVSRNNDKFKRNKVLDINEVYQELIKKDPEQKELVSHLYNSGVLREHINLINNN